MIRVGIKAPRRRVAQGRVIANDFGAYLLGYLREAKRGTIITISASVEDTGRTIFLRGMVK